MGMDLESRTLGRCWRGTCSRRKTLIPDGRGVEDLGLFIGEKCAGELVFVLADWGEVIGTTHVWGKVIKFTHVSGSKPG